MMRSHLGSALVIGALGVAALGVGACSAGKPASQSRIPSSDTPGSSTGGAGSVSLNGGGGASLQLNTPTGDTGGTAADPDPGNPNITHATCGAGACLDFPAQPIVGDGVPPNAATLFGDPTKFTAGGL